MKLKYFLFLSFSQIAFAGNLTELANKFCSDKGTQYICAHHYTRHYEKLFENMQDEPINLLEIGLNIANRKDCASLQMWLEYFPKGKIYGVDICPQNFKHPRCQIFVKDCSQQFFLDSLKQEIDETFDVIIDDASHASYDQQLTFINMFDKLKSGGLYFIEDLHYQPEYEYPPIIKSRDFFHKLNSKENLNCSYLSKDALEKTQESIESITFYDSARYGADCLVLIKKR